MLQQTVAWGAHFPSEHPAYIGALNRDQKYVRRVLSDYDLMFCVGADVLKMSVWSETEPLPETTAVAMVGLRDWEMGKNFPAEIALRADVKETLKALVPLLKKLGGAALADKAKASLAEIATRNWSAQRAARKAKLTQPVGEKPLQAEWVMMRMTDKLPKDAILVEEGLTSTTTLMNYFAFRDRNSFFGNVSGGIGWGIAAAVGVQIAEPKRRVVAVIGDGSAMYSITALWTRSQPEAAGDLRHRQQRRLPDPQEPPKTVPRQRQADRHGLQRPADGHLGHRPWLRCHGGESRHRRRFRCRVRPGAGEDGRADADRGDGEELTGSYFCRSSTRRSPTRPHTTPLAFQTCRSHSFC